MIVLRRKQSLSRNWSSDTVVLSKRQPFVWISRLVLSVVKQFEWQIRRKWSKVIGVNADDDAIVASFQHQLRNQHRRSDSSLFEKIVYVQSSVAFLSPQNQVLQKDRFFHTTRQNACL